MKKTILILDFETTGVDATTCFPIEFAGILCDENLNLIEVKSFLIKPPVSISEEVTQLTGLTNDMCNTYYGAEILDEGKEHLSCPSLITEEMFKASIFIAHNGINFDFKILERIGIPLENKLLIDTLIHLPLPANTTSKRLNHLCTDFGILHNKGHRGLSDCIALHSLLSKWDINEIIKRAESKTMTVIAIVSFDDKEKAKQCGFQWNAEKKVWQKSILECDLPTLTKIAQDTKLQFKII